MKHNEMKTTKNSPKTIVISIRFVFSLNVSMPSLASFTLTGGRTVEEGFWEHCCIFGSSFPEFKCPKSREWNSDQ